MSGTPPAPRSSHRAAALQDRIVIFGGCGEAAREGAPERRLEDVHTLVASGTGRLHWSGCDSPCPGGAQPQGEWTGAREGRQLAPNCSSGMQAPKGVHLCCANAPTPLLACTRRFPTAARRLAALAGRAAHSMSVVKSQGTPYLYVLCGYLGHVGGEGAAARKFATDCYRLGPLASLYVRAKVLALVCAGNACTGGCANAHLHCAQQACITAQHHSFVTGCRLIAASS